MNVISKNRYMSNHKIFLCGLFGFLFIASGCKNFIEVDAPTTSVNAINVYEDNSTAAAVLTGIYAKMAATFFSLNLSVYPELSSDNLELFDQNNELAKLYYQNALRSSYAVSSSIVFWNDLYANVYVCNAAIEGLNRTNKLNSSVKQHLLGEAYFMRSFYYFYLINLYGDVPLAVSTDYSVNATLSRSSINTIYKQIVADLNLSQQLLDNNYLDGGVAQATTERLRPNKMAATALLARVYLYMKNYAQAETEASAVINQTALYFPVQLDDVFMKNSKETIWALQPVKANLNTDEGNFYIYTTAGPNNVNFVNLSTQLLSNFEIGDQRKRTWIGNFSVGAKNYAYPRKYKVKTSDGALAEYTIVLRLAEQFLIRAEARAEQNNISGAQMDLNVIRHRAGLGDTPAATLKDLRIAILRERRMELFSEWGNRWFDLKRTGQIDVVMSGVTPLKGGIWETYNALYPIPLGELQSNPLLIQNKGY
jgi:hypothetical protein